MIMRTRRLGEPRSPSFLLNIPFRHDPRLYAAYHEKKTIRYDPNRGDDRRRDPRRRDDHRGSGSHSCETDQPKCQI